MKKLSKRIMKIEKNAIHYWIHYSHYLNDIEGRKNNATSDSGCYCWIFPKKVSNAFIEGYCSMKHEINGIPTVNEAGDFFSDKLCIERKGSRALATIFWGYDI